MSLYVIHLNIKVIFNVSISRIKVEDLHIVKPIYPFPLSSGFRIRSILAQERLLGAALGTVFSGVIIFEQRRDIYRTISQNQPPKSQMKEATVSRNKFEFAQYWNKSVDQIFGPAVQALSSRRW
ncbi:hypothetical protein L1987_36363 [Smallanthus sonchifolius]|uniref:Uncharacterized protein n=1 Tax=Smallanthus sonchifolius TaxID=185202 RepID=A0ACB9HEJ0_9ASTR|nr:hypothetical protein L1987_36363 [Smallanthus sonchifolius]